MRRRTIGLDKIAIRASNPTGTICVMSDDEPRLAGRPCQDNSELGETIFRRAPGAVPRRWLKSSPLRHCSMNRDWSRTSAPRAATSAASSSHLLIRDMAPQRAICRAGICQPPAPDAGFASWWPSARRTLQRLASPRMSLGLQRPCTPRGLVMAR